MNNNSYQRYIGINLRSVCLYINNRYNIWYDLRFHSEEFIIITDAKSSVIYHNNKVFSAEFNAYLDSYYEFYRIKDTHVSFKDEIRLKNNLPKTIYKNGKWR